MRAEPLAPALWTVAPPEPWRALAMAAATAAYWNAYVAALWALSPHGCAPFLKEGRSAAGAQEVGRAGGRARGRAASAGSASAVTGGDEDDTASSEYKPHGASL